jgi:hypothetical protein
MPGVIEPETLYVDDLPGIWSPVQWEQTKEEQVVELEEQARASLLWAVDVPEAVLRLLLSETDIERAYQPPSGYNHEQQGEWDDQLITFQFKREIRLVKIERERDYLYFEYKFGELGYWAIEIEPQKINIQRL